MKTTINFQHAFNLDLNQCRLNKNDLFDSTLVLHFLKNRIRGKDTVKSFRKFRALYLIFQSLFAFFFFLSSPVSLLTHHFSFLPLNGNREGGLSYISDSQPWLHIRTI